MRLLSLLFLWGVCGILAGENAAPSGGGKVVSLITIDEYPPFCFRPENAMPERKKEYEIIAVGENSAYLQGYEWDLVRAAWQAVGYTIILRTAIWDVALTEATSGESVENLNSTNKKRGGDYRIHFDFGADSYLILNDTAGNKTGTKAYTQLLFPAEKNAATRNFAFSVPLAQPAIAAYLSKKSSLTDVTPPALAGKNIGFLKGCGYDNLREIYAAAGAKILDVDDATIGFNYLRSGRLSVLFGYAAVFDYDLRANKIEHLYQKIPTEYVVTEYLIGAQDAPQITEILADFARGLQIITDNGTKAQLLKKWKITE